MLHLYAVLTTLWGRITDDSTDDPERGSVTIEHVLWAVAVIVIVGIVVAAITTYVTNKSGLIQ